MSVATQKPSAKSSGGVGETVKIVIQALLLALVVRTLLFQPFVIPSASMKSTLLVGDYIFVSKYSYGYSRYSLPYGFHLFDGRVWSSPPERGDIAVFKLPRDNSTDYIKRVIGLPGDRIQMKDGVLYINDEAVKRERVDDWISDEDNNASDPKRVTRSSSSRSIRASLPGHSGNGRGPPAGIASCRAYEPVGRRAA
jgi:signal peptidase I